jgi:TP901 family phage tail tape measure protein
MAFVIPTIYTAIDKVSAVATKISAANMGIARSAELAAGRAQHAWDNFLPKTDDALKRRFEFMVSMGKAMAIAGTAIYSTKAIMDYEKELANLKALTGATGVEFEGYKRIIQDVAKQTTVSSVDIAQAFTAIGNAMPELLGSADALGQMTNAAVTLGRAANMEMLPAAEALTGIMNQFGKSAEFAGQAIDIMAAGSQAGSAELQNLQATMLGFGKAAVVSGIKFEEAINIAELISKTRKGAEAGVQLRNIFVEMNKGFTIDEKARKTMQRLGIDIRMISNAAIPVKQRLQEMTKLFKDSSSFAEVFGKENEIAAITLLENIGLFDQMNARLKEQGVAARMAKEQTQTLYAALNRVKAAWTNIITESGGVNAALTLVKWTLGSVANNLGLILNIAVPILGFFAAWRVYIMALAFAARVSAASLVAWNIVIGISTGLTGGFNAVLLTSNAAFYAYAAATYVANAAIVVFNSSLTTMLATIGAITGGLALIYLYRDKIQNFANDSAIGMAYNKMIGDTQVVNESILRKFKENPESAKQFLIKNPEFNTPEIQRSMDSLAQSANTPALEPAVDSFNRTTNVNLKSTPVEIVLKDTRGNVLGTGSSSLMPSITNTY